MESPLDILSRAAGMVSRNHEIRSGNSSPNSLNNESNNSCRILKLALVSSSNNHNDIYKEHSPKLTYINESSPATNGGKPIVVVSGVSEDVNNADSDTPLDMSIKKPKRRMSSSDTDEGSYATEDKVKRKRPSVISYASHHASSVAGFDVDDHFKKSLGLEFYNSVFSEGKKRSSTERESPREVPSSTTEHTASDDECNTIGSKPTTGNSVKLVKTTDQSAELENTVDDHFAKALGKSTWMRLQQGL